MNTSGISAEFHSALTHYQAGNLHQAVSICEDLFRKNPKNVTLLHFLGILHQQLHNYDAAIKYLKTALEFDQNSFEGFYNLGSVFEKKRHFKEAIDCYQKVIQLNPNFVDAYINIGNIYHNYGRLDEAISFYKKGIGTDNTNAGIFFSLGVAFQEKGQLDEAMSCYRRVIELKPDFSGAHNNLGHILSEKGDFDEATAHFQKAIHHDPHNPDIYNNLGISLKKKGQLDEAITVFRKAVQLNANYPVTYHNLGNALYHRGQLDEAITVFRKAVQLSANYADAHLGLSHALLLSGNFQEGWKEYEWRWKVKGMMQPRSFSLEVWDGSSLHERNLFVYDEQGVGDKIMFASCLPEVIIQAGLCVVETDKRLVSLFSRSFPGALVTGPLDKTATCPSELSQTDVRIALGSLPMHLRPELNSFGQQHAYLIPDPQKLNMWRNRFQGLGNGLKIGISWHGGKTFFVRRVRSTVLSQWKDLFSLPGVHFINLQYGECSRELRETREKTGVIIHHWPDADPLKDLDDFAAQVAALDLVISVDNATVHMAGALGVKVWTLLPFVPDWRWMLDRENSPWYPAIRLFRQPSPGDWKSVFRLVRQALEDLINRY